MCALGGAGGMQLRAFSGYQMQTALRAGEYTLLSTTASGQFSVHACVQPLGGPRVSLRAGTMSAPALRSVILKSPFGTFRCSNGTRFAHPRPRRHLRVACGRFQHH
jgi:hypothetical protein